MSHTTIDLSPDVPIACSLTADEYRRRAADMGDVARSALRSRRPIDGGAQLIFEDIADVGRRLEDFVAAESKCCPFLSMQLRAESGTLILDVTGPPAAAPIIEELFA